MTTTLAQRRTMRATIAIAMTERSLHIGNGDDSQL
jgi:hypothetical protein